MPRSPEPPRLHLRAARLKDGKIRTHAAWVILDGGKEVSTGCRAEDRAGAERALADYIGDKHEPNRRKYQQLAEVFIADLVSIYLRDKAPPEGLDKKSLKMVAWRKTCARYVQLLGFWGEMTLDDINQQSCRDYVEWRCKMPRKASKPKKTGNPARMVTAPGVRRELECLRAAVNHHARQKLHTEVVVVTLPEKGNARTRYLRRDELARMVWIAWKRRENARILRGPRKGQPVLSPNRPSRHIAKFLLIGAYTGTRAAAIGGAAFKPTPGHGWVDLKRGLFYRQEEGTKETNKRQPTIMLPRRLLMHMRRWRTKNPEQRFVIEWRGQPVKETNKGFARIVQLAGLGPEVTPHVMRHTCATWLSQRGASMSEAAGYLGMSQKIYEDVYRHLSPTVRSPGFWNVPIWEIFDPKYHPNEVVLDDGWIDPSDLETEAAA